MLKYFTPVDLIMIWSCVVELDMWMESPFFNTRYRKNTLTEAAV